MWWQKLAKVGEMAREIIFEVGQTRVALFVMRCIGEALDTIIGEPRLCKAGAGSAGVIRRNSKS